MGTQEAIQAYRDDLLRKADETPGFTYDQFDFVRKVQTGQALLRGVDADFRKSLPDALMLHGEPLPEELRYAVTYVERRGWCLWATTREGTDIMPRDRDWHPLESIRSAERVGFAGVFVRLLY